MTETPKWADLYGMDPDFEGPEPTYTAAEVSALAKTAGDIGRELGRNEAAQELADRCLRRAQLAERIPEGERSGVREGMVLTWLEAERLAREIGTR